MSQIKNKTVVLGITGSIAAYKMANVASDLAKNGVDTHVIMTPNATEIISPLTFSTLTGNNCIVDTFDKHINYNVAHVALAKRADVFLIAPATANVIGKLAHGIADDMLTTTAMAMHCKKLIAPAMNTHMYENPALQRNLKLLEADGYTVIEPDSGMLACKDEGKGKLVKESVLLDYLYRELACDKDYADKKVLITAGPTQEAIDPVRFISNHSSGKMGYALAKIAMQRGADVTLISGPTALPLPAFVRHISVRSSKEMFEAVKSVFPEQDIVIKAAAVADYTPKAYRENKIKKDNHEGALSLELQKTDDIISYLTAHKKSDQFICGFSMETENLEENSRKKLMKKKLDMIVANNLFVEGAGFQTDTNVVTIITEQNTVPLPVMSKEEVAETILDTILLRMES